MAHTDGSLKNIVTGLVAPKVVSIMEVKDMGTEIISDMAGKAVSEYSFKKNKQAIPIPAKQSRKKTCDIQIDSGLLFQRIISTYFKSPPEDAREAFS